MSSFKFLRSERLKNKSRFRHLFESGKTIRVYPLKLIYILPEHSDSFPPLQFAFTVPKRNFKKAVDRNYIRRRIKESLRLRKPDIYESLERHKCHIYGIFIFTGNKMANFHEIDHKMEILLNKLNGQINRKSSNNKPG